MEVVWFPFDLPNLLVKEIIWESGGDLVTSVLYGTPAAGSGVLACLEMGCSVLSLCEIEHHMEHLMKTLQSKLVQCVLNSAHTSGSGNIALRARSMMDLVCEPEVLVQACFKKSSNDIRGQIREARATRHAGHNEADEDGATYDDDDETYRLKKRSPSHKQASRAEAAANKNYKLTRMGLIQRKQNNKHALSDVDSVDS